MTEPVRFIGSKGLKADLIASAKADRSPAGSRRKALVAAAAAVAAGTKAASATASLGAAARLAAWKWIAVGALGVGTVVAAKAVIAPPAQAVAAVSRSPAGVPAPYARPTPAPVHAPTPLPPEAIPTPPPLPEPSPTVEAPIAKPQATAVAPIPAIARAPSSQPSSSGSRLSVEISAIDQAKRALASGDAVDALRQVDAYRATFPAGTLSAEASAVRVEALARAGRRDEARAELARLRAGHPDSPLLENLGPMVGE